MKAMTGHNNKHTPYILVCLAQNKRHDHTHGEQTDQNLQGDSFSYLYAWKQNFQQLQIYTKPKFNTEQISCKWFNSKYVTCGCGVILEFVRQHA